jgi:hypothetical protein
MRKLNSLPMRYLKEEVNLADKKHLISLAVTVFVLLAIPLTVFSVIYFREPTPKAQTPQQPEITQETVAGLLAGIHDADIEYEFSYDPRSGKAEVAGVALAPHGLQILQPETNDFLIAKTVGKGKVAERKHSLNFSADGTAKLKVRVLFSDDRELELKDKNGKVLYKAKGIDLPLPDDLATKVFSQKQKK